MRPNTRALTRALSALAISAGLAMTSPSSAVAGVVIENNFPSGSGNLTINLYANNIDTVKCTGSALSGTVSNPATANATLTSWTWTGCSASYEGQSLGLAAVAVQGALPSVTALGTNVVKLGAFTIRAQFTIGGTTCSADISVSSWNYSYYPGPPTNDISVLAVPHIYAYPGAFPPPNCPMHGIGDLKVNLSFPSSQFKLTTVADPPPPPPPPTCDPLSKSRIKMGDMNGDGKADIFVFTDPADGVSAARVWRSNGTSFTPLGQVNTGFGLAYQDRLADWDGDGDDDVFQFTEYGRVDGWRSNATSYTQLSQVGSGFPHPCETKIADMNGDSKDDIFRFVNDGNGYVWQSTGTPTSYSYKGLIGTGFGLGNQVLAGDMDGDGDDDLFQFTEDGRGYYWRSNGTSYTSMGQFGTGFGSPSQIRIGDRDGDGDDDLFQFTEDGRGYWWRSNGTSYTSMGIFTSGFGASREVRIADINGDAKADILEFADDGNGYAWLGTGTGFTALNNPIGTGFGTA
jgi:hypothetical protein